MVISWLGHACWRLATDNVDIATIGFFSLVGLP